ncbi:hypothetical protein [Desulfopila inferna]|uniref:hypothetical protein n=1 Tax=Desulfopila inferna TaxID=468528 RepID=UPI0019668B77|nr:hypothetical protein [Desulfopila inferna]MBM9604994.1 hypothetical protein [Desulfopila inferna]
MIEMGISAAQTTVEKMKHFAASPLGIFFYAAVPGMVGIIILLGFMAAVIFPSDLPNTLPFIIAFNSAASGYGLVDKGGDNYPGKRPTLFIIALVMTVTGCSAITIFCPWESLVEGERYFICASSAIIFTFFGAWLGSKSKKLSKPS